MYAKMGNEVKALLRTLFKDKWKTALENKRYQALTVLLTAVMLLAMLPALAPADTAGDFTVTGGEAGTDYTYAENTLTFIQPGTYEVAMNGVASTTADSIAVNAPGSSEANPVRITLSGVDIRLAAGCAFDIQNSSCVSLALTGANVLTSGNGQAGLHVPEGAGLSISGPGSLAAAGGSNAAGIGGNNNESPGPIEITGGVIKNAVGGVNGAGIGGGSGGNGGMVGISGGTVTAKGGSDAAGIGGGSGGDGGAVTITGGSVSAYSEDEELMIGKGAGGASPGTVRDGSGRDIYLTSVYLEEVHTVTGITSLTVDGDSYGSADMYTDGGWLFLYLPNSTHTLRALSASKYYTGDVTTRTDWENSGGTLLWSTEIHAGGTYNLSDYADNQDRTLKIGGGLNVTLAGGAAETFMNLSIECGPGVSLTLQDVNINVQNDDGGPLSFTGEGNTLTLAGASTLRAYGYPGVRVESGTELTIGGDGSLTVTGGARGAGIGGNRSDSGTITIAGGTVNATGGLQSAGIGGGAFGNGGTVTISGGTVTISGGTVNAAGGAYGAGIGGGHQCDGGTITINSGTVHATGGSFGAGLGGGHLGAGGTLTINGGTVNITGGEYGAGIGGGTRGAGGTLTINGGTVHAAGGSYGAGIGGGGNAAFTPGLGGPGGTVTLAGGVIFAQGGQDGEDIGPGDDGAGGSLAITDTAAVFLRNDNCLAPAATTHTHLLYTGHDGSDIYGLPVAWTSDFGAWLRVPTLSYDLNGGSGTVPAPASEYYGATTTVTDDSLISRTGYTFAGWNTAADSSGTAYAAGDTFTFVHNTVLYAQWTSNGGSSGGGGSGGSPTPVSGGNTSEVSSLQLTTLVQNGQNLELSSNQLSLTLNPAVLPAADGGTLKIETSLVTDPAALNTFFIRYPGQQGIMKGYTITMTQ